MTPAYMPFTHLPEFTAQILSALVGPVAVYQPLETRISDALASLADQGLIEIRTPLTGDEDRLKAALAEFTQWAAQNPGRSTAGAGYVGSQQGKVPFFDESTINRIRSEIKQHGNPPASADDRETAFSARLFLAVAEENDRTTATLDQNLRQFKALEQGFLESLVDSDEADFSRQPLGSEIWQDDPGAKQTEQRIRAWASLAAADSDPPDLLITTSAAVMDTLLEAHGEAIDLQRLTSIRLPAGATGQPLLAQAMADLMARDTLMADDCDAFSALSADAPGHAMVTITLYAATGASPPSVIRQMAPVTTPWPEGNARHGEARHTPILLVEPDSKSD